MEKFIFSKTLNKHGFELIEAYKTFIDENTAPYVQKAIATSMLKEKNSAVIKAIKDPVSIEEFTNILYQYSTYIAGTKEMCDEAIAFVESHLPEGLRVNALPDGKFTIRVEKYIGIKMSAFKSYFGVDDTGAKRFYTNGFVQSFVDTRIRKLINDVFSEQKSTSYKWKLSETYKHPERNLFNIAVYLIVDVRTLSSDTCKEIEKVVLRLNEIEDEFS